MPGSEDISQQRKSSETVVEVRPYTYWRRITKLMNTTTVAKAMRWTGRILSLPIALFFLVFGLGYFFDTLTTQGWQSAISSAIGNIYDLLGIVATVLTLVGIIISWWWLLPAGILIIFAYFLGATSDGLGAAYHVGYFHWSQFQAFWSITNIIYLVAAILFIMSWRLSKKNANQVAEMK